MSDDVKNTTLRSYSFFEWMRSPDWRDLGVCWPSLDIPDRWVPAVELVAMVAESYPDCKAVQVKNKFGGLRIYTTEPAPHAVMRAIELAEMIVFLLEQPR